MDRKRKRASFFVLGTISTFIALGMLVLTIDEQNNTRYVTMIEDIIGANEYEKKVECINAELLSVLVPFDRQIEYSFSNTNTATFDYVDSQLRLKNIILVKSNDLPLYSYEDVNMMVVVRKNKASEYIESISIGYSSSGLSQFFFSKFGICDLD